MASRHPKPDPLRLGQALQAAVRRRMAERSLAAFTRIYLVRHCKAPPSRMHQDLSLALQTVAGRRGSKLAVAAPRGHAKSTIVSLSYVLWSICFEREKYIILISNSVPQANTLLEHVKTELETNSRLREDFPGVCEPPEAKPPAARWRQDEIITRNSIRVASFGEGKRIRGRRHREHRPSLIIVDDVENEEQVGSVDRREKVYNWFTKAVLKLGDHTTNVIVIGTIMHYDSLLARLVDPRKSPGWKGAVYRAVVHYSDRPELWGKWESIFCGHEDHDGETGQEAARKFFEANERAMLEGTEVLWPEWDGYYQLMTLKLTEGRVSFDSEKQNDPIDPAECTFPEEDMHIWDARGETVEELLASLGDRATFYGACDPSLGKAGRHRDPSAIVTLVKDWKTGVMYVIDADIDRRSPDRIIETIITYHRLRKFRSFGFESNQFQEFLANELKKRSLQAGSQVPVFPITNTGDKVLRIVGIQPMVKSGAIRFSRRHRTLLEQLRQFPKGTHDDGPDALQMAVQTAERGSHVVEVGNWGQLWPRMYTSIYPSLGYRIYS